MRTIEKDLLLVCRCKQNRYDRNSNTIPRTVPYLSTATRKTQKKLYNPKNSFHPYIISFIVCIMFIIWIKREKMLHSLTILVTRRHYGRSCKRYGINSGNEMRSNLVVWYPDRKMGQLSINYYGRIRY